MLEQIYETADTIRDNINGLNYQQKLQRFKGKYYEEKGQSDFFVAKAKAKRIRLRAQKEQQMIRQKQK